MIETDVINNLLASDIIAMCAIVISLLTANITIKQSNATKQHNILSVKPSLNIDWDFTGNDEVTCLLTNKGIGPAYLSSMKFYYDERSVEIFSFNNYMDFFKENSICTDNFGSEFGVRYGGFDNKAIISPGNSQLVIAFYRLNSKELNVDEVFKCLGNVEMEIIYKCAYGNEHKYKSTKINSFLNIS